MSVTTDAAACRRELAKPGINCLPEAAVDKAPDFMAYQAYSLGINIDENDDEDVDIESIPAMMEIIQEGINTPLSECKRVPEEVFNA